MTAERPRKPAPPTNDPLSAYRRAALVVFLAIDAFLVGADVLGRLFKDNTFHVDPVVFGLAFGTTLTLLGLEGFSRLWGSGK